MADSKPTITLAQIRAMPRNNGLRCSLYCPKCGQQKGMSQGCYAHTMTEGFTWWKCRNCKFRYDLTVTKMKVPYRDGFGLDEPSKKRGKVA